MQTKYFNLVLLFIVLLTSNITGQIQRCSTKELEHNLILNDPTYITRRDQQETDLQTFLHSSQFISNSSNAYRIGNTLIIIPVVVHLIGDDIISQVSLATIQGQIQILNNDYRKILGTNGSGNGVDTQIEFRLACKNPTGGATNGIVPISAPYQEFNNTPLDNVNLKSLSHWPSTLYLNIWVCNVVSGKLAWGTFPAMFMGTPNEYEDGVVCGVKYFGMTNDPNYGFGRTLSHEVGHWLDLYHTWGDESDCTGTDFCDDTPMCNNRYWSGYSSGCVHPSQCIVENAAVGSTDIRQIENYMDYSDDLCMNMFTQNQKDRMLATIDNYRSLLSLTSCDPSCSDGIQNGDETGIDCGGSNCPPCGNSGGGGIPSESCNRTEQFTINGELTGTSYPIVNICQPNIMLAPHDYTSNCTSVVKWNFNVTEAHGLCSQMSFDNNAWRWHYGIFDNYCGVKYCSLFIAIQECDENRNLIGSEYSHWVYFSDNDLSTINEVLLNSFFPLNLYDYLPPGFSFEDGKYYKIKVATFTNEWLEYNGYIRIYKDDLLIQNQTITHDQFANNITIENSTVPVNASIKVDAKTKIEILPSTTLESGTYYIENFDCGQLSQFRALTGNDNSSDTNSHGIVANISHFKNSDISSNYTIDSTNNNTFKVNNQLQEKKKQETINVNIYPNPASNEINIEFELKDKQNVTANLFSINSIFLKSLIYNVFYEKGLNKIKINSTDIVNGVYFIQLSFANETVTKKIIILKE